MIREDGVELVRLNDGKSPWTYLGKPLAEILEPMELTVDEFIVICDRYTNRDYFKVDEHENLLEDRCGNLVKKDEYLIR
mgnify:CR=1 FL=1